MSACPQVGSNAAGGLCCVQEFVEAYCATDDDSKGTRKRWRVEHPDGGIRLDASAADIVATMRRNLRCWQRCRVVIRLGLCRPYVKAQSSMSLGVWLTAQMSP